MSDKENIEMDISVEKTVKSCYFPVDVKGCEITGAIGSV